MAYNAKKTEHAGAKKGTGAFYGEKAAAKKASNRRVDIRSEILARMQKPIASQSFVV